VLAVYITANTVTVYKEN